ncbi:MAG TPA: FAD-linked oxidase C-terminal domain-containing protein [Chitinophagales bacterium]|nr:FAD-linked oxidase C-terminal domain-containing protein [Chitinophagales bacterium]HMY23145.1 FAD-linked oxidase C-terminal domain-containing protein [Chitinophagales bacterium]HMZ33768.1 FAD-linked oxidase C-terminal domain-containing protein [Chitinophagales bacterium]HNF19484.1 FAD-linked oxidase C-terminal domain-containing protein [Chitinophagales bacterium]HNG71436.1 FAD-linked oxidase C-terminal domain-containing protein [Chitinophagales bacterium]
MKQEVEISHFEQLKASLEGELYDDKTMRTLYATDASVYKEYPLAVCYPKSDQDIQKLIQYALQHNTSLIPRTAGTSLGGQVVGNGIVVDMSKHLNKLITVNKEEKYCIVQPGMVRDELNRQLSATGLFFAPETSTANRAMIGGMVGNNSCGTNSIVYGSTRDHVIALKGFLSDGSAFDCSPINAADFHQKSQQDNLEGSIYSFLQNELSDAATRDEIISQFPNKKIHRRNTGYAVDELLYLQPFTKEGDAFNLSKLICGSEGTLAFITEIKLNLVPVPPKEKVVVAIHFKTLEESLRATVIAMRHQPSACELMDKIILDCTKQNIEQNKNRFFVKGDPEAILCVEFHANSKEEIEQKAKQLQQDFENENVGYHFPYLFGADINKVWNLRKAGLGLLANIPGDAKAVAVIEDTAVAVEDLPNYIADFTKMMDSHQQRSVYYAHAGAGELHLRPILDLKKQNDRVLFRTIATETANLVKKYNGSLSGEHGDGRVRGEFIPLMVGEKNYQLLRRLKYTFDKHNIFNPGKIVDTPPMDTSLRYEENQVTPQFDTVYNFDKDEGILRAAEKCNGSGDCRKLPGSGGTMCPSYMATRNEKDTTRARANILRDFLSNSTQPNKFNHKEIYEVMDLCLSCKGCTSECPSNVDIPTLKAEFLHQYYKDNGVPLRTKAIANIGQLSKLAMLFPALSNFGLSNKYTSKILKKILRIAPERSMPLYYKETLLSWYKKNSKELAIKNEQKGKVYFFFDEFTNFNDVEIGIKALKLLTKLGYEVDYIEHVDSGRAHMSKGLILEAQKLAKTNVSIFSTWINKDVPLIGIEPSAILSFRDEYPRLVERKDVETAKKLAKNCFIIDEFIAQEIEKGNITAKQFTTATKMIKLHGHCHQKALSSINSSIQLMSLPENYHVENITSGCCGMAGSFGYEKEHFEVSMQVGELVLFPAVRNAPAETIIAAPGTSCRHQIKDGTQKHALHPIEVLYEALL